MLRKTLTREQYNSTRTTTRALLEGIETTKHSIHPKQLFPPLHNSIAYLLLGVARLQHLFANCGRVLQ